TRTFGFVWTPDWIPHLGVTVDYYDIKVNNAISIRPIFDITDACYNSARNTTMSATNASCLLIHRNPLNGTMEGDLIYGVNQVTQNIGNVHAEGIDYGVHYSWDLGSMGNLDIALDGTHVIDSSYVPAPGGAKVDCVAHYGKQCGLPNTVTGT